MFEEPFLPCHVDIDLGGGWIIVAQHVLNSLDGHPFFHHQRATGVPERVRCDLGIIDADGPEALLDNLGDGGLEDAAVLTALHEVDEQRALHVEVITPERQVILQRCHHLVRNCNDIIVVSHCATVLIEYLNDGDVTVDCEDGLTLLLEFLLVTQHISPAGCPGIDTLSRQPAEPEVNLPPVI